MESHSRGEPTFYTIGHSTRAIEELIELLSSNGVRCLVDVRRYPGSRRYPQFNREVLARSLETAGIRYQHEPALGGRRGSADEDSPNTGWRNASFRAYADHLASQEFRAALDAVIDDARERPVALMCAEAVPWRCHRQLISDVLVARGYAVAHIISNARPRHHELNDMARVAESGVVTYPGPEPPQQDLFGAG